MNPLTILEDYSSFSDCGIDLMKTIKDTNCASDLDCISNKKQSTIEDFCQTL